MSEEPKFFDGYSLQEIHEWYMDLAKEIDQITGGNSTAAKLLQYYLNPKEQVQNKHILKRCREDIAHQKKEDGTDNFFGSSVNNQAGTFILDDVYIRKVIENSNYYSILQKEYLSIFLSKKDKNKGILKRISDNNNFVENNNFEMTYYKSLGFDLTETWGIIDRMRKYYNNNTKKELSDKEKDKLDVFLGLHNYTVKAKVNIIADLKNLSDVKHLQKNELNILSYNVSISSWKSTFFDYYDFDPTVGFDLPNPDYTGNPNSPDKIHPESKQLICDDTTHSYLIKMVEKNLAAPFYVFGEHTETSQKLLIKDREIRK